MKIILIKDDLVRMSKQSKYDVSEDVFNAVETLLNNLKELQDEITLTMDLWKANQQQRDEHEQELRNKIDELETK